MQNKVASLGQVDRPKAWLFQAGVSGHTGNHAVKQVLLHGRLLHVYYCYYMLLHVVQRRLTEPKPADVVPVPDGTGRRERPCDQHEFSSGQRNHSHIQEKRAGPERLLRLMRCVLPDGIHTDWIELHINE